MKEIKKKHSNHKYNVPCVLLSFSLKNDLRNLSRKFYTKDARLFSFTKSKFVLKQLYELIA